MTEIRYRKPIKDFAEKKGITGDWRTIKRILIRRKCLAYEGKIPVLCIEIFETSTDELFSKK